MPCMRNQVSRTRRSRRNEKLATIGILSRIGSREYARLTVLVYKVLVWKRWSINA